mmetsp:Transcript_666/g.2094  ORF Transcript_666/g.2094 Transcript_666/m.2094 type:complete len:202 (-) Transcript_666:727-1332(-)
MTPAMKYPAQHRERLMRSWRSSSEIRSPGMAMSPRPRILNWPGRPWSAGIFSTMGTLWPVPPPVATSIMTDFLKIKGDKNTQNMSKKNVHTSSSVPTFRFGSRSVRWMVNNSPTAIRSCRIQPNASLLRYRTKLMASAPPTPAARASEQVWSSWRPMVLARNLGKRHALHLRKVGHQAARTGSSNMVDVDTAPVANRNRST